MGCEVGTLVRLYYFGDAILNTEMNWVKTLTTAFAVIL